MLKGEERSLATQSLITLVTAENELADASSGYKLIDSMPGPEDSRTEATAHFLSLLNTYGARETTRVHQAFRETYPLIKG